MIITGDKLSIDCETTGLAQTDNPFCMTVSNGDTTVFLDHTNAAAQIDVLNKTPIVIAQNFKFDWRMLAQWGLKPTGQAHDTEVLGRIVRNDHMSYSLAAQAKRYGMEKSPAVEDYIAKNKLYTWKTSPYKDTRVKQPHFDHVPLDIIKPYAMQDARVAYDLHSKLTADLDPRTKPVWELEQLVTKVCYGMERRGVLIDRAYTQAALEYEQGLIREAMSHFHMATGQPYSNKKSLLVEVFAKAGEIIPKTEKGNDQLTDDVLESFTSPAAKLVQKIRHHEKRIATYYSSFLELAGEDDVIHPDMRQAGTTTGRFSYREPNLQNIPLEEDSADRFVVRGCFKPRPGYVFVAIDYKQQEYRLMLAYANHWKLIQQVMSGADVHQAMADMVGIGRKAAKTLNFACLYGAGPDKIAAMLGISVEEARALRNKYFARLIEVQVFIKQVMAKGQASGHVYNWLGRKMHITSSEFAYALPNHLIQGGGADICKTAMVNVEPHIFPMYDCHLLLQWHDALVFEMRPDDMSELIPRICKTMVDSYPGRNGMHMDVDVKWSEKSLAERDMRKWQISK